MEFDIVSYVVDRDMIHAKGRIIVGETMAVIRLRPDLDPKQQEDTLDSLLKSVESDLSTTLIDSSQ